jgi:hypothetical protein
MTIEDQIAAMFARANPVPSLDLLDPIDTMDIDHLTSHSERSSVMSEIHTIEPELDQPPARRPVGALVAAGVMVVAAAVVIVALANREPEVAATPVEIAESFLEARNAHNAEAMSELLADDAVFVPGEELLMNEDNLPAAAEFEEITGWTHEVQSCVEDFPSRVRCNYAMENDLGRALGRVPIVGTFVIFEVEEGRIVTVQNSGDSDYIGGTMVAFGEWVEENHPEVAAVMLPDDMAQILEPEALALWKQYIPEFVASVTESG